MENKKSDIEKFIEKEFPGQEYHKLDIPPQPASQEAPVKTADNENALSVFDREAKKGMIQYEFSAFKRTHPTLLNVILSAMEQYAKMKSNVVQVEGQEKDAVGLRQANIAMAFKDEFEKERQERKDFTRWLFMDGGLHEISNNAAKRFLDLLTYQPESIGRQDAVGQDVEWKNILNFFKGEYVLNNNTTIEEIIRDLKMRYTLYLNRDKK